ERIMATTTAMMVTTGIKSAFFGCSTAPLLWQGNRSSITISVLGKLVIAVRVFHAPMPRWARGQRKTWDALTTTFRAFPATERGSGGNLENALQVWSADATTQNLTGHMSLQGGSRVPLGFLRRRIAAQKQSGRH